MKLASDEGRAVAFVLGLIALAAVARVVTRPRAADVPAAAEVVDAGALEEESEAAAKGERARARPLGADERIDVNSASAAELDRLPGVGAALAQRIVAERERGGAFDSPDDMRAVSGIGPAKLARIAENLTFGPAPGLARREHAGPGAARAGEGNGAAAMYGWSAAPSPEAPDGDPGAGARRPAGSGSRTRRTTSADRPTTPLDINRATAAELEQLPGIGPALAARIIAKRDSMGGFRRVDDLDAVRGIGPAKLQRLRPYFGP